MKPLQQKILRTAAKQLGALAGYDPLAAWAEFEPDTRAAVMVAVDLMSSCRLVAPPSPPAELAQLFAAAAAAERIPAQLLEALSWELARYGEQIQLEGAAGVMALPAAVARASATDQVRGAAAALRRNAEKLGSMTAAVIAYCGSVDQARRVLGSFAVLTLTRLDVPPDAARELVGFLEG